ncbi:hypothetical protein [Kiloniella antarctica]|uniref:Uncharacterized protein n=1 Tax=Kiloniella antarctica TaxID=1550907 RepID=A0ABW5BJD1_9PROT
MGYGSDRPGGSNEQERDVVGRDREGSRGPSRRGGARGQKRNKSTQNNGASGFQNDLTGPGHQGGNSASNGVNRRGNTYSGPKGAHGLNKGARQAAANSVGLSGDTFDGALGEEDEQGGLVDALSNGKSVKVHDLTLNPRGKFVGSKSPTQSFAKANPQLGGIHSPEMQGAYNSATRGAAGIGTAKSKGLNQVQLDVLRSLASNPTAQRVKANEFFAKNNPAQAFFSTLGSRVLAGVNSVGSYSLDEEGFGTPGQYGGYNPVEGVLGYLSRAGGVAGAVGTAAQLANFAGYDVGKSYGGFTTGKQGAAYSRDSRARRSVSRESEPRTSFQSLFDRASKQLYPDMLTEEDRLTLGVGVSQGKSKVRRAPNLSTLKSRRANFERVR